MAIMVLRYHTDNGVFTAAEYHREILAMGQDITFSGVGAHHQNGVAERGIGTIFSMTRTVMIHAKLKWPKVVSPSLWPMAMKSCQHTYNHTPKANNVCPMDIVLKQVVPRTLLRNLHVWGAPCYVLDPKLQDGHKIPKWNVRSRRALHLGASPKHAATVPKLLNLQTGHISSQYHVVFDDDFSTVSSADQSPDEESEAALWDKLFVSDRYQFWFDEDDPIGLEDYWLSEEELRERVARQTEHVAGKRHVTFAEGGIDEESRKGPEGDRSANRDDSAPPTMAREDDQENDNSTKRLDRERSPPTERSTKEHEPASPTTGPASSGEPTQNSGFASKDGNANQGTSLRRSQRTKTSPNRMNIKSFSVKAYLALALSVITSPIATAMATEVATNPACYAAYEYLDDYTGTYETVDFASYQAAIRSKSPKRNNPDLPSFHQAMSSAEVAEWQAAMDKEISTERTEWQVSMENGISMVIVMVTETLYKLAGLALHERITNLNSSGNLRATHDDCTLSGFRGNAHMALQKKTLHQWFALKVRYQYGQQAGFRGNAHLACQLENLKPWFNPRRGLMKNTAPNQILVHLLRGMQLKFLMKTTPSQISWRLSHRWFLVKNTRSDATLCHLQQVMSYPNWLPLRLYDSSCPITVDSKQDHSPAFSRKEDDSSVRDKTNGLVSQDSTHGINSFSLPASPSLGFSTLGFSPFSSHVIDPICLRGPAMARITLSNRPTTTMPLTISAATPLRFRGNAILLKGFLRVPYPISIQRQHIIFQREHEIRPQQNQSLQLYCEIYVRPVLIQLLREQSTARQFASCESCRSQREWHNILLEREYEDYIMQQHNPPLLYHNIHRYATTYNTASKKQLSNSRLRLLAEHAREHTSH